MRKTLLLSCWLLASSLSMLTAQTDLSLRLEAEKPTLLAGEQGTFTFILENIGTADATDIGINFTRTEEFQIVEGTATTTSGTFENGWNIETLQAGSSDTLRLEAESTGYAFFIAEVTAPFSSILAGRCVDSNCYPIDNLGCFYTNCTTEAEEVLYPTERYALTFAEVNCSATGLIGCGTNYDIVIENPSNVSSAPVQLFARVPIIDGFGVFYRQLGETLTIPSIAAGSTFEMTADFGTCPSTQFFESLGTPELRLTESNQLIGFLLGNASADVSLLDAVEEVQLCEIEENRIDLELALESNKASLDRYLPNTIIYRLNNNSPNPATNVEITLDLSDKTQAVLVGEFEAIVSRGIFKPVPKLWQIDTLSPFAEVTLEVQYFPLVENYVPYAQVTDADQEDIDSTPNNGTCCTLNEDDEAALEGASEGGCSFFREYSNAFDGNDPSAIELEETEDAFVLTAQFPEEERTLTLNKTGELIESNTVSLEATPATTVTVVDDQLLLLQINADGDTLINELISVDYPNPTAIVSNNNVFRLSDGYLIGGFIVDSESTQMFRAFFVKTDLNGQSAQTVLIEDLNDTFFIGEVLEERTGKVYIYWGVSGNFSLSCTSSDLSTTWVRQFAGDTPSTTIADIVLSQDESIVYVALTDNLRGEVIAYNTADGTDSAAGFTLLELLPTEQASDFQRMNGILPLEDGSLLFAHRYFDRFSDAEGFQYGLIDASGALIWSERVEGTASDIRPIASVEDGFLLMTLTNDLIVLKTNANGVRTPACENLQFIEPRMEAISNENKVMPTLTLYPNPTSDVVHYRLSDNNIIEWVKLYNLRGRQVLVDEFADGQLSLQALPNGTYILLVHTKEGQHRQVVVKD